MGIVRSPLLTESDNPAIVRRGSESSEPWSEITVAVFDENKMLANPLSVTGTITGMAIKSGSGKAQDFTEVINLENDDWSWQPELSIVQEFRFSAAGLNQGYSYQITVHSWGED